MQKLNPEIAEFEIGVRHLRKVIIYPLSAADQFKLTDLLKEIFSELAFIDQSENKEQSVALFFGKILDLIKEKFSLLVGYLTDEDPVKFEQDVTNSQLADIIKHVYEVNFEGPLKKVLAPFKREGEEENFRRLISEQFPQPSVKSTTTNLKTSTGKASGKGV